MTERGKGLFRANLLYAIAAWGLIAVGVIVAVATTVARLGGSSGTMPAYGAAFSAYMVIAEFLPIALPGLIMLLTRKGRPMIASMRLRFTPSALLALPAAVGGYLFVVGITAVWSAMLTAMGLGQEMGAPIPQTDGQFAASLLVVAVWPALCEEFLFRGILLPAYERHLRSPVAAVVFTGLIFGLIHGQVASAPGQIFLGVMMGMLVVMTGSLWTGVLYHLTNNACAMALSYLATRAFNLGDFPGLSQGGEQLTQAAASPLMMALGGLIYIVVGGVLLALFLAIFYAIFARERDRRRAQEALTEQRAAADAAIGEQGPVGRGRAFLPWLPLAIAAPVVIGNYVLGLIAMIAAGMP